MFYGNFFLLIEVLFFPAVDVQVQVTDCNNATKSINENVEINGMFHMFLGLQGL